MQHISSWESAQIPMSLGEHILSLGLFTYSSRKPGELSEGESQVMKTSSVPVCARKYALQICSTGVVVVVVVDVELEE